MSSRKVTPVKKILMAKQLREHMERWTTKQNTDKAFDWPIPAPRTIGEEFDRSGGVRTPLEVPAQPVEWRHEGGIMVGTPPKGGGYQSLHDGFAAMARNDNGLMALVEGLRALASSPEIIAGEESGAFISGLLAEVECRYPGELLALLPSVAGEICGAGKHKKTAPLKERIIAEMKKHETEKRWKNPAARKVAPNAFKWNNEAYNPETKRTPYTWPDVSKAEKEIRRWLDN